MKVVLIATRDLRGRLTGRKTVLRTIVRTLAALGHDVLVIVLGRDEFGLQFDESFKAHMVGVKLPGLGRVLLNAVCFNLPGRLTLNECLYSSPSIRSKLQQLTRNHNSELVVADMLRTGELAEHTGLPWLLDLDDLLSTRYAVWLDNGVDLSAVLGYYDELLPSLLRPAARWLTARLLKREATLLRTREVELARRATAVSLVSITEVDEFSVRCGRRVHWLPMAVDVPELAETAPLQRPLQMAFTGGLDYQPNQEAALYFAKDVLPELQRAMGDQFRLNVYGFCPPETRVALECSHIVVHGYVENLHAALSQCALFLCPLQSGTGIKTKVVEALLLGMPVVTTPAGTLGLDLTHGKNCFLWETPTELVNVLQQMEASPVHVAEVARAGKEYARARFTPRALEQRWREVLEDLSK